MRKIAAGVIVSLLCAAPCAFAEENLPQWPVELQTQVVRISRKFSGQFALYVKDLKTNTVYTYNASTPMYLASTVKIPVMIELFDQVEQGKVSLDEEMTYQKGDIRDGAPLLNYLRVGTPISMRLLVEAMIQQSDNAATDMVIRKVGMARVNKGLVEKGILGFGPITTLIDVRRLVYRHIDPITEELTPQQIFTLGVTRPVEARVTKLSEYIGLEEGDLTARDYGWAFAKYYREAYNSAPMNAMGALLEKLAKKQIINEQRSQEMLDILLGTQTGARRIRAGLPPETPIAHKTGTQYRRICDVGIFYMPEDRPVVFSVCVKGGKGKKSSEDVVSKLANRTYQALSAPRKKVKVADRGVDRGNWGEDRPGGDPELERLLNPNLKAPKSPKRNERKKRKKRKKRRKKKKSTEVEDFE